MPQSAAAWLDEVLAAERRGELLSAIDLAERGLEEHPGAVDLQHRVVLALARAGSTEQAARRFEEYGLGAVEAEDVQALEARLAKDVALCTDGERRRSLALRSADLYAAIAERTGGYYPTINAATLRLVGGDAPGSRALARQTLALLAAHGDDRYYAAATAAEAHLLLGDLEAAAAALERAADEHEGDHAAVATTRRQLRLVCTCTGVDPALLAILAGPRVVHYCGHRISSNGPFPASAEESVAGLIHEALDRSPAAYAYGSLASGADILWAEALLERGAELHVVLPFALDEFVAASVADAGPGWVDRFEHCLAAAAAVSFATDDAFLDDDVLYRYGSELAMGFALLRARFLDGEVGQLALWDGKPARGAAGTATDVETWRRGGRATTVVRPPVPSSDGTRVAVQPTSRVVRAILFADVKGFSRLGDEQLRRFAEHVLGTFARVLDRHADAVCFRNTWGDGLYVVLEDAVAAAGCALDLQEETGRLDLAAHGLPPDLALRLGAHVGPVFPLVDPVLGAESFMGSHVSRTARIEPVTPVGAVYATEPFAAALELAVAPFVCDYVGHMPAAKDFGRLRMYAVRRGL